jgi:hypothetical protein
MYVIVSVDGLFRTGMDHGTFLGGHRAASGIRGLILHISIILRRLAIPWMIQDKV